MNIQFELIFIMILFVINVILSIKNIKRSMKNTKTKQELLKNARRIRKDAEQKLKDAEYKRWQVIHHHYVQDQIKNGEKELTMLHDFIRQNDKEFMDEFEKNCKFSRNIHL